MTHIEEESGYLDSTMGKMVTIQSDIENAIKEIYEVLTIAGNESLRMQLAPKKPTTNRSVPWWTDELTIRRNRLNAFRRRYHRTTNNDNLRPHRETKYLYDKARYNIKRMLHIGLIYKGIAYL